MPRLRNLTGEQVIRVLAQFGFVVASQRGSHAKLRRLLSDGTRQTPTVPRHKELDKGTLRAILRQAARFIPEEQLRQHFYSE